MTVPKLKIRVDTGPGLSKSTGGQKDVSDYLMGYYNQQRPHSFNGGIAPVEAEENLKLLSGMS